MGITQKALFVATGGLSGLVFKDDPKKQRTIKAGAKPARAQKRTTAKRPAKRATQRPATRATQRPATRAARRPAPQAARGPTQKPARISSGANGIASADGTIGELERLVDMHGRGALTDWEFAAAKATILGTSPTAEPPGMDPATFPAIEANVAAARHLADLAIHDRGAPAATNID
jgi:hypothetical protein